MNFLVECIKFIFWSLVIVGISKYFLVTILRRLAESLDLKPKTVGIIAGIATSVPELLTVSFAAITGFLEATVFNILSSNVINTLQYSAAIILNKNGKLLQKKLIRISLVLVAITILLPFLLFVCNVSSEIGLVPILLILFILFFWVDRNANKLYGSKEKTEREKEIEKEEKEMRKKKTKTYQYVFYLTLTSIALFIVGNLLSNSLENLCNLFNVPEIIIGILLGFITSLPELITFFESQRHHQKEKNKEAGIIEATNNLLSSNCLNLFIIQAIGIILYHFSS